jgi:hypothetical protein
VYGIALTLLISEQNMDELGCEGTKKTSVTDRQDTKQPASFKNSTLNPTTRVSILSGPSNPSLSVCPSSESLKKSCPLVRVPHLLSYVSRPCPVGQSAPAGRSRCAQGPCRPREHQIAHASVAMSHCAYAEMHRASLPHGGDCFVQRRSTHVRYSYGVGFTIAMQIASATAP